VEALRKEKYEPLNQEEILAFYDHSRSAGQAGETKE
jgi:hypothetical protein